MFLIMFLQSTCFSVLKSKNFFTRFECKHMELSKWSGPTWEINFKSIVLLFYSTVGH